MDAAPASVGCVDATPDDSVADTAEDDDGGGWLGPNGTEGPAAVVALPTWVVEEASGWPGPVLSRGARCRPPHLR
jgi:hypothetical protein